MIRSARLTMIVGSIGASLIVSTLPAHAAAATATTVVFGPARIGTGLTVTAGNAANTITLSFTPSGAVQVNDKLAPVTSASRTCAQIDTHTLVCPSPTFVTVLAGAGDDVVKNTTSLPSTLDGAGGADLLVGGTGPDRITGGAGNDVIDGGLGADLMDGGGGRDRVNYASRTAGIRALIDAPAADAGLEGEAGEGDTLTGIEDVTGGSGDDEIGSYSQISGVHAFVGGAGNDKIHVTGSADVDAGPGDDSVTMDGDGGPAIIHMGAGNDVLGASWATFDITADLGAGNDTAFTGSGQDDLAGGDGNDSLQAGWFYDPNIGAFDADVLAGGAGNDRLIGNNGADKLLGGPGFDILTGGPGFDLLDGGADVDVCDAEADGGALQNCEF